MYLFPKTICPTVCRATHFSQSVMSRKSETARLALELLRCLTGAACFFLLLYTCFFFSSFSGVATSTWSGVLLPPTLRATLFFFARLLIPGPLLQRRRRD